ncbi:MAG: diguanylate cyclase [Candidatus Zixiibacteriota bacterium]
MEVFYNSGKTFLPRIDAIFLQARGLAIVILFGWVALGLAPDENFNLALTVAVAFAIHYGALMYLIRRPQFMFNKIYFLTLVLDTTATTLWITFTGGFDSAFFLGYYLIVALAAYLLTRPAVAVVTSIVTLLYVAILWPQLDSLSDWMVVGLRVSPCWIFFAVISHIAEHLQRSEERMLKLFDTLNMRTSELEKIQAQLESIYDNSRILAGILDVDEVIKAVVQIVNGVLKYPAAAILFKRGESGFIYRGRVVDGEINLRLKSLEECSTDLLDRVARAGTPVCIVDCKGRDDYTPLKEDTRSVMMAPMTVRRTTVGVMVAESKSVGAFSERDEKMFWVVARSAAMAIDNAIVHREMEDLTVTDELTGIFNYRYFTTKLTEEQRRAARYNQPLSLIMIDIDHFKGFNDSFGHEAGNSALKNVTQVIGGCIRDTDVFARYGGEEFAIILPQTTLSEAEEIANRIRESIESTRIDIGNGIPRQGLTVSIGLTSFPENGKRHDELVQLADQALYRAKGGGRNIVQAV